MTESETAMNDYLILGGALLFILIVVHMIFRVVKTTIVVFLLGVALIVLVSVFRQSFGIDLLGFMSGARAGG